MLVIKETADNMSIKELINNFSTIFHKYFPNQDIDIKYVHNKRDDNLWITALAYGQYNTNTTEKFQVEDVINFAVTVYLNKIYDDETDVISYTYPLCIVPSACIYLPKYEIQEYADIVGSGRTTRGDVSKILNKFDRFCSNCKSTYKKYYK